MSTLADTWQLIRRRDGLETLAEHVERRYAVSVARSAKLDVGVYRFDLADGRRWVVRIFPAARPLERAEGDADILRFLEEQQVPAERRAHAEPVSTHEGQAVLVTEWVAGTPVSHATEQTFRTLGALLGQVHALPEAPGRAARPGGAIHSFVLGEGSLRDEVSEALTWLADAGVRAEDQDTNARLVERVTHLDFGDALPQALTHPDLVFANLLATGDGHLVLIDWTGAGRAPRAHALAFLLLTAVRESRWNPKSPNVDAVLDGYREHVRLTDDECAAIATGMPLHVLVRDIAAYCMGRMKFEEVAGGYAAISRIAITMASKVADAFR